ncbi:MAG: hypothetical protein ABI822_17925 [Bryobacteraceae bacterium]
MKRTRRASITLTLLLAFGTLAPGQVIVRPSRFPPALKEALDHPELAKTLKCDVTVIKPTLNFSFRFQAGYIATVPLKQYSGRGHGWVLVTKITPEGPDAKPVHLVTAAGLPDIPKTNQQGEIGGGYLLGEGRYEVEWTLFDDAKRICQKNWTLNVALTAGERKVKTVMPPNTIGELSLRGSAYTRPPKDDVRPIPLTIFLHAAPLSPRRTKLRPGDALVLLSGLASFLERVPSPSVRLIVFNMDQQKVLFQQDNFALDSLDKVAQSINGLELGLVDYQILRSRRSSAVFLADLIDRELAAPQQSDVALFLGPASRFADKVPQPAVDDKASPYFYQFQFAPPFRRGADNFPDTISQTISKRKGKTIVVHNPGEFAKAIDQLERHSGAQ